jgi:hypothetical protein
MQFSPVMRVLLLVSLLVVGASSETNAQSYSSGTGLTALACYVQADAEGLEEHKAVDLCLGAPSSAPALCYQAAEDQLALDDSLIVQLCRGAASTAPVQCAVQLEPQNTSSQYVPYCAAQPWPVVPNVNPGIAACFQLANDTTSLSDDEAARLCRGSTDTSPVDCFQQGTDQTSLDDSNLVTLCAPTMLYSPTSPLPGYGY